MTWDVFQSAIIKWSSKWIIQVSAFQIDLLKIRVTCLMNLFIIIMSMLNLFFDNFRIKFIVIVWKDINEDRIDCNDS